jgi:hypothetical protein
MQPITKLSTDNRFTQRKRIFKAGKIALGAGGSIDATVRNISDAGALLQVESILDVPDEFVLIIQAEAFKRRCKIAWRRPKALGVRFV